MRDTTGNLPRLPGVFPDYMAPIVRNAPDGVRELTMARWGMPSSQFALMQSAEKRAAKIEAKGHKLDFKELLRDGIAYLQAGGGIVADSDPAAEHEECLNKLRALETAIELAEAAR